ncbi:MAG: hypothetical protein NZ578_01150 [Candidatus Binatia bacterium]|nr:hypothetical protein [Candidatus Binatia bacterium]
MLTSLLGILRKMPTLVLFATLAVILYFTQGEQPPVEEGPKFRDPEERKELQLPRDLPPGTNPSVVACVQRVDSQLSNGLWADIYYGMEVRLDGKMVTVKVTEKWQGLSEDKRKTVTNLVVDTWVENGKALQVLRSKEELEEVVIKRLPDDQTVASWKPATGVQLFSPQREA